MPGDRFIELAMTGSRHVLDVLFSHAGEAVTVQDRTGTLVYANDRAAHLLGYSSGAEMVEVGAAAVVKDLEMIDVDGGPMPLEQLPGRRVLGGASAAEATIGYRSRSSRQVRWSKVRASPIKNDRGEVVFVLNYFLDITDQVDVERRDRLLADIRDAVLASTDVSELVSSILDRLVPEFCQAAAIHLLDDIGTLVGHKPGPPAPIARRQEGLSGWDPESSQARVVAARSPLLVHLPAGEPAPGIWSAEDLGVEPGTDVFVATMPLRAGSRTVGALTMADSAGDLSDDDIALLMALAGQAGTALANALLVGHQHQTAEILQRGLKPESLPSVAGVEFAVRYEPQAHISGVSGDFYDVVPIGGGRYVVAVGDIEGKGIGAAARVGMVRQTLRATVALDPSPVTVFNQLNELLRSEDDARMCTLAYLILEGDGQGLTVALAGHPPPIRVSADGSVSLLGQPCPPLGVVAELEPIVEVHTLARADTVVLYTDGYAVTNEAPPESITPRIEGAQSEDLEPLLDRLLVELHSAEPDVRDDVVLLAFRVNTGSGTAETAEWASVSRAS
jgi:hypothetical protein